MRAPPTDPLYDVSHPDESTKYPAANNRKIPTPQSPPEQKEYCCVGLVLTLFYFFAGTYHGRRDADYAVVIGSRATGTAVVLTLFFFVFGFWFFVF